MLLPDKNIWIISYPISAGDCHDASGHKDRCVTGAIYNYTKQLESASHDSDSLGLKCKKQ